MSTSEDNYAVTDERLAWLVAREEIAKRAARPSGLGVFSYLFTALGLFAGGGRGANRRAEARGVRIDERSQKMREYAFAVDAAAEAMTPEERANLRAHRELPQWFMADVERRREERLRLLNQRC